MRKSSIGLLFLTAVVLNAQVIPFENAPDSASARIAALRKQADGGDQAAVGEFWAEVTKMKSPLVEPISGDTHASIVTFVFRGKPDTRNVVIFGGPAGLELEKNQMIHLAGTDVWYRSYKIRNDARFMYQFSVNDSLEPLDKLDPKDISAIVKRFASMGPDPLNPRRFWQSSLPSSYVELSEAPEQTWIVKSDAVPQGKVEMKKLHSNLLKNDRIVWVYTPPGFEPGSGRYALVVAFDGEAYTKAFPVPVILDNLIAQKRIPPVVALLVGSVDRNTELPCYAPFADYLAKELVPWMRENYRATSDPALTVVGGFSYGGLAATFAALQHPEVFGKVLSQSGSFWWAPDGDLEPEWLTRQFVKSGKLGVRFFMEVGLMEAGPTPHGGPSQVAVNRHMRDVLTAKGYELHYQEFNGGHETLNWRGSFGDGLSFLLGHQD